MRVLHDRSYPDPACGWCDCETQIPGDMMSDYPFPIVVAFLASDRAAFASGVDYFLDGGAFPAR